SSMMGCELVRLLAQGDKWTVEKIYAHDEMKNHLSTAVLVGEHLYGYSSKGVACQDFKTGKIIWTKKGGGSGSLTFADGCLYCYHERPRGEVLVIKATPAGCKEVSKFRIPETTKLCGGSYTCPVVANGKLYLRDQNLLFCYDV